MTYHAHMHELTISLPFAMWYSQGTVGFLVHKLDNQPQPTNQETYMYPWAFPSGYYLNYTGKVSQRGNIGIRLDTRGIKYKAYHHKNVMVGHLLYLFFIHSRNSTKKSAVNLNGDSETIWTIDRLLIVFWYILGSFDG